MMEGMLIVELDLEQRENPGHLEMGWGVTVRSN